MNVEKGVGIELVEEVLSHEVVEVLVLELTQ